MENGDLAGDLLDGVKEIAAFTGWSERQIYYLAEGECFLFSRWAMTPASGVAANQPCGATSTLLRHRRQPRRRPQHDTE